MVNIVKRLPNSSVLKVIVLKTHSSSVNSAVPHGSG